MTTANDRAGVRRDNILFGIVIVVALAVAFALRGTPVTADTTVYRDRVVEVFSGRWPYIESEFEHFPLTLIPMSLAWVLGGWVGNQLYRVAFSSLMAVTLWGVFRIAREIGSGIGRPGVHRRWLWISAPLLPLVLFRNDPWSLLFAGASLASYLAGRRGTGWLAAALGIAAKGWPVVLALVDWSEQRRRRAILLVICAGALAGALTLAPGFQGGREFAGLHTESTLGGLIGLGRSVAQSDPLLIAAAGATYLAAPNWAGIAQLGIGMLLLALVLMRTMRGGRGVPFRALGPLTVCVLIGSPLLSAQFVLWPSLFLALDSSRTRQLLLTAAGALSTSVVAGFSLLSELPALWFGMVTLRNVLLFLLVAVEWGGLEDVAGERVT